jgi:hypothetical protein
LADVGVRFSVIVNPVIDRREVVPGLVELEVAVPRLTPTVR